MPRLPAIHQMCETVSMAATWARVRARVRARVGVGVGVKVSVRVLGLKRMAATSKATKKCEAAKVAYNSWKGTCSTWWGLG